MYLNGATTATDVLIEQLKQSGAIVTEPLGIAAGMIDPRSANFTDEASLQQCGETAAEALERVTQLARAISANASASDSPLGAGVSKASPGV